eukprot:1295163-Rhodomonas_salina.1
MRCPVLALTCHDGVWPRHHDACQDRTLAQLLAATSRYRRRATTLRCPMTTAHQVLLLGNVSWTMTTMIHQETPLSIDSR